MKTQSLIQKLFCALAVATLLPFTSARAANVVQDANANYIAWEAENDGTIVNAGTTWAVLADSRASGGSCLSETGARGTDGASSVSWTLVFNQAGTYTMYIKYMLDPCCGANSYLFPAAFGPPSGSTAGYKVTRGNENGAGPTDYTVVKEREQNQTAVWFCSRSAITE